MEREPVAEQQTEQPQLTEPPTIHRDPSSLDVWSTRLAAWSQIGVLIVLTVGYVFTVRPAFQYQLLQEQAAKLEMEKEAANVKLQHTLVQQSQATERLASLNKALVNVTEELGKLTEAFGEAKVRETDAKQRVASIEKQLATRLGALTKAQWELLLVDFRDLRNINDLRNLKGWFYSDRDGRFIATAKNKWPDPYALLMSIVDTLDERNKKSQEFPREFISELKQYIKSEHGQLVCEEIDFEPISRSFQDDMKALEPAIESDLAAYIEEVKRKIERPFTQVEITEDFKNSSRRQIRLGKELEVMRKYRDKLSDLQEVCEDKAYKVMDAFRIQKGVKR